MSSRWFRIVSSVVQCDGQADRTDLACSYSNGHESDVLQNTLRGWIPRKWKNTNRSRPITSGHPGLASECASSQFLQLPARGLRRCVATRLATRAYNDCPVIPALPRSCNYAKCKGLLEYPFQTQTISPIDVYLKNTLPLRPVSLRSSISAF